MSDSTEDSTLNRLDQLHLTRLNGLVQLRTQFHHIDASAQLEAVNRRREKEAQEGTKPAEPKAFLPLQKKSGGDTAAEQTQAFMKAANQEPWHKLAYFDENVCCLPSRPRPRLTSPVERRSVRLIWRASLPGGHCGRSQTSLNSQQRPVPRRHQCPVQQQGSQAEDDTEAHCKRSG
jgi:hypothetical protein